MNGISYCSASCVAAVVVLLWYAPMIATTPSSLISLLVAFIPSAGLLFVSAKTGSSKIPPSELMPPSALTSSTARITPFVQSFPFEARFPDMGKSTPTLTVPGSGLSLGPRHPANRIKRTIISMAAIPFCLFICAPAVPEK
ncbi:MAG: hypothetical protein BWY05_01331 [Euryarchaeota archaeon ADurb.Bin165]|nr:MAG: hypothetical protein BWY05_01331 [Euryarchaeota archaeon ADurb.Bin165]